MQRKTNAALTTAAGGAAPAGEGATAARGATPSEAPAAAPPQQQVVVRRPSGAPTSGAKKGRLDGDCSLITTFNRDAILKHLTALRDDFNAGVTPDIIRINVTRILDVRCTLRSARVCCSHL